MDVRGEMEEGGGVVPDSGKEKEREKGARIHSCRQGKRYESRRKGDRLQGGGGDREGRERDREKQGLRGRGVKLHKLVEELICTS